MLDERLNILSDPYRTERRASTATAAGVPAEVVYFVRNGILENLVFSRFWAQEKQRQPTAGPVNRIMESSAPPANFDEMIGTAPRALLVSRFWYIRSVDPRTAAFTGLTRDGVWYIENGKI